MILEALHDVFVVLKWLFGFGALMTLLGIGLALLWFAARAGVARALRHRPADRFPVLRKLFLDVIVSDLGFAPHPTPFPLERVMQIREPQHQVPSPSPQPSPARGEGKTDPSTRKSRCITRLEGEGQGGRRIP